MRRNQELETEKENGGWSHKLKKILLNINIKQDDGQNTRITCVDYLFLGSHNETPYIYIFQVVTISGHTMLKIFVLFPALMKFT